MKAPTEQKTEKRILFLKPTKGAPKKTASVMRKSIESDQPEKPLEVADAGNLSHLTPLLDTLRKRRTRSKTAAQPAPSAKD